MKVAIVGAGAIGGYVGGLLSAAGEDVTFIARGANLDAIRRRGMQVVLEDGTEVSASNATACERPGEAGPQAVVYLTVKAHQVTPVAPELDHLCHETTSIVTMQNGIPWWYFQRLGGPYDGRPVKAADPDGSIARLIDPARIIEHFPDLEPGTKDCRRGCTHDEEECALDEWVASGQAGPAGTSRLESLRRLLRARSGEAD